MSIKLKGSTDGSVTLQAPADTSPSGSDKTLTLPTTTGSANQFVKNGSTAGQLEYSSMVETSTGDVQARRARSNTAGDVALSVQPSDSSIHYGFRIDSTNNSLNLDRASGTAANLLTVDSSGNVGINATSPDARLHVSGAYDQTGLKVLGGGAGYSSPLIVGAASGTEYMRVDDDGRLLVGTSSDTTGDTGAKVQIVDTGTPVLALSRNDTSITSGNTIGQIRIFSNDDSGYQECARIAAQADGTFANNDKPTRLVFSTTADGAGSPTERMRIDSSGRVGINVNSFSDAREALRIKASSGDGTFLTIESPSNTGTSAVFFGDDDFNEGRIEYNHNNNALSFHTNDTERVIIANDGSFRVQGVYNFTLASSANVHVDSGGLIRRVTSSAKYKTNIETIEDSYADALLNCRPVWYQSTCEGDNPDYSWWGFIAEEVAEIDPRLVHWKTTNVTYDEDGRAVETPCDPEAEGVLYDRFVPHLVNLVKRQKTRIETLETQYADLLARVTALEAAE